MNWKSLGQKIGKYAPLIGKVLPIPGGGLVGTMVAAVLGVEDTPDAISKALDTDPEAAVKLQALQSQESQTLARIAGETAIAEAVEGRKETEAVNATMQAESKSEHWPQYSWRPAIGFTFAGCCLALVIGSLMIASKAITTSNVQLFAQIPIFIGSFTVILGSMATVLGVAAHHRGHAKRIKAGGEQHND